MAKKERKAEEKAGAADWLATYSDMMTVLFVLFVLLFSMSSVNPVKWDLLVQTYGNTNEAVSSLAGSHAEGELTAAVDEGMIQYVEALLDAIKFEVSSEESSSTPPGGADGSETGDGSGTQKAIDFEDLYLFISQIVTDRGYAELIDVEKEDAQIMIRFKDKVFFQSGMATLSADGRDVIMFIGAAIQLVIDEVDKIKVEGHTDNVPQPDRWSIPDNWALGSARANSVIQILEESGIPNDRRLMESASLSATDPRESNDTPEGRAANRRVEIYITRAQKVDEEASAEDLINESENAENAENNDETNEEASAPKESSDEENEENEDNEE